MGVVWHGSFLMYFEDAREYFGTLYGIEYLDIHSKGYFVPIVESGIKHLGLVRYGDKIEIRAKWIQTRAAKIEFRYEVFNLTTQIIAATGMTTQVFLDAETQDMILYKPDFFKDWEEAQSWKNA